MATEFLETPVLGAGDTGRIVAQDRVRLPKSTRPE